MVVRFPIDSVRNAKTCAQRLSYAESFHDLASGWLKE
jgi:hypothetical protein